MLYQLSYTRTCPPNAATAPTEQQRACNYTAVVSRWEANPPPPAHATPKIGSAGSQQRREPHGLPPHTQRLPDRPHPPCS
jgi:hypothetical protein